MRVTHGGQKRFGRFAGKYQCANQGHAQGIRGAQCLRAFPRNPIEAFPHGHDDRFGIESFAMHQFERRLNHRRSALFRSFAQQRNTSRCCSARNSHETRAGEHGRIASTGPCRRFFQPQHRFVVTRRRRRMRAQIIEPSAMSRQFECCSHVHSTITRFPVFFRRLQ